MDQGPPQASMTSGWLIISAKTPFPDQSEVVPSGCEWGGNCSAQYIFLTEQQERSFRAGGLKDIVLSQGVSESLSGQREHVYCHCVMRCVTIVPGPGLCPLW